MAKVVLSRRRFRSESLTRAITDLLEPRRMFCGEDHGAIGLVSPSERELPTEVVAMFNESSGHITRSQFNSLPADVQAQINPHEVEDDLSADPVDFDKLLGIPTSVTGTQGGPEADALPDFFPSVSGSFSTDQTSQSGRVLLRFGTQVNNAGDGPATLISGRPGTDPIPSGAPISSWVNPDGSQNVLQAVYQFNGSSFTLASYRAAGRFTYHSGHGHFHFDGYANYRLRSRNPDGTPGDYVTRADGTGVVGAKTGFCLININSSFTLLTGGSSTTLPNYGKSGQPSTGCGLLQGISVGFADVYSSGLEGQWIDVTGVPNGQYFLEMQLDGENAVAELSETNNTRTFLVNLSVNPPAGGITPDVYDTGTNNNTLAAAADLGVLGTFTQTGLTVHWGQDFDYFKFVASSSGNYTVASTAANGNVDIYLLDAAGVQLASSTLPSGTDTITYNFVAGQTYYVRTEAYNSTTSSNYQIAWTIKPQVTNSVQDSDASEVGANRGTFLIGRNGPTTSPLTVNFTLGGTAVNGVDYQLVQTSVSIGDLQSVAAIDIIPLNDSLVEATETVTLTVSGNSAYVIGGTAAQTITLADTPPTVVASGFEYLSSQGITFDFSLNVSASLDLSDIEMVNQTTNSLVPLSGVTYDLVNNRARFSASSILPDGRYAATLLPDGVTHALGAPLPTRSTVQFFVLAGDADHNATVNLDDFTALAGAFGGPGTFAAGDFNYSGQVDLDDFTILASQFGTSLPPARPAAAAALAASADSPFSLTKIRSVATDLEI